MICFQKIAERRIIEAIREGAFDDLPGAGQPLKLEDDSHVPEDLRMVYKILKNAGYVPQEVALRKEIAKAEDLLDGMEDTKAKYSQIKKLNFLIMKLNTLRGTSANMRKSSWSASVPDPSCMIGRPFCWIFTTDYTRPSARVTGGREIPGLK